MINLKKCKDECVECNLRHSIKSPNLINSEILKNIEDDCTFCSGTKRLILDTEARLDRIKEAISQNKRVCITIGDTKLYGRIDNIPSDYSLYQIKKITKLNDYMLNCYMTPFDSSSRDISYNVPDIAFPNSITIVLDKGLRNYKVSVLDLEFTDNRFTKFELEYLSNLIVNDNGSRTLLKKIDLMIEEM